MNATLALSHPVERDREKLYQQAVSELGAAMSRVAAGYEADRELRRDLMQEMHASLWLSLASFDGRCSLKTWTWRVSHNVGASHLGKQKNAKFVELEEVVVLDDVEAKVDRTRTLERLTKLIHALKPLDRQLVLLYLEGLDALVISEVTGLSAANVATRVHRLKATLAKKFHEGSAS